MTGKTAFECRLGHSNIDSRRSVSSQDLYGARLKKLLAMLEAGEHDDGFVVSPKNDRLFLELHLHDLLYGRSSEIDLQVN